MDQALYHGSQNAQPGESGAAQARWEQLRRRLKHGKHMAYIYTRRLAHWVHGMTGEHPSFGPACFLAVSAALGVALTVTTLYSSSYQVMVDGQCVGVVEDQSVVTRAMESVERQGSRMLGQEFRLDDNVDYEFALTLASELDDQQSIETYFYEQLDEFSADLRNYQIVVNGQSAGSVEDEAAFWQLLEEMKQQYINENTISVEVLDTVTIRHVYNEDDLISLDEMKQKLVSNKTGETT